MDWTSARIIGASCAASFLMFLAFALLAMATVASYGAVRGLKLARDRLPYGAARVSGMVDRARRTTRESSDRVVRPQIDALAVVAGVRAGIRALITGRARRPEDHRAARPSQVPSEDDGERRPVV